MGQANQANGGHLLAIHQAQWQPTFTFPRQAWVFLYCMYKYCMWLCTSISHFETWLTIISHSNKTCHHLHVHVYAYVYLAWRQCSVQQFATLGFKYLTLWDKLHTQLQNMHILTLKCIRPHTCRSNVVHIGNCPPLITYSRAGHSPKPNQLNITYMYQCVTDNTCTETDSPCTHVTTPTLGRACVVTPLKRAVDYVISGFSDIATYCHTNVAICSYYIIQYIFVFTSNQVTWKNALYTML